MNFYIAFYFCRYILTINAKNASLTILSSNFNSTIKVEELIANFQQFFALFSFIDIRTITRKRCVVQLHHRLLKSYDVFVFLVIFELNFLTLKLIFELIKLNQPLLTHNATILLSNSAVPCTYIRNCICLIILFYALIGTLLSSKQSHK